VPDFPHDDQRRLKLLAGVFHPSQQLVDKAEVAERVAFEFPIPQLARHDEPGSRWARASSSLPR